MYLDGNEGLYRLGQLATVREVMKIAKEKELNVEDFTRKDFEKVFKGTKEKPGIISLDTAQAIYMNNKDNNIATRFPYVNEDLTPFIVKTHETKKKLSKPIPIKKTVMVDTKTGVEVATQSPHSYREFFINPNVRLNDSVWELYLNGKLRKEEKDELLEEVSVYHYKMNTDLFEKATLSDKDKAKAIAYAGVKMRDAEAAMKKATSLMEIVKAFQ